MSNSKAIVSVAVIPAYTAYNNISPFATHISSPGASTTKKYSFSARFSDVGIYETLYTVAPEFFKGGELYVGY